MIPLTETGVLEIGVEGATVFALRPATLADTYVAAAAVPVPANLGSNEPARVAYQMAIDDAVILCQLTQLGALEPVPSVEALVAALDPDDMVVLREAAAILKKKLRLSRSGSAPTADPNTSSSAPASA